MSVKFSGTLFAKSLLATTLSAALATTAFAQSLKPETDSNPISPAVQTEGSHGKMEHHRIGDGKPHQGAKKHSDQSAKKHNKSDRKEHHKRGHHRMGDMRHAAIVIPGLGAGNQKLVDDLKLTDDQKAKLQSIKDERKEAREPNREVFKKYQEERRKQLDSGNVDPKALLAAQKDLHDSFEQQRADGEAKWLGLWDTFSDEQKATVVKHFKDRSAKWEEHRKQFKEKHAKMKEMQNSDQAATPAADTNSSSNATPADKSTDSTPAAEAPKQ